MRDPDVCYFLFQNVLNLSKHVKLFEGFPFKFINPDEGIFFLANDFYVENFFLGEPLRSIVHYKRFIEINLRYLYQNGDMMIFNKIFDQSHIIIKIYLNHLWVLFMEYINGINVYKLWNLTLCTETAYSLLYPRPLLWPVFYYYKSWVVYQKCLRKG